MKLVEMILYVFKLWTQNFMKNNRKRFFAFIGKIIVIKVILHLCSILPRPLRLLPEPGRVTTHLLPLPGDGSQDRAIYHQHLLRPPETGRQDQGQGLHDLAHCQWHGELTLDRRRRTCNIVSLFFEIIQNYLKGKWSIPPEDYIELWNCSDQLKSNMIYSTWRLYWFYWVQRINILYIQNKRSTSNLST